jgi:predicted solute-binding protein
VKHPVSTRKLRLAAVSFLNARPITYGLERGDERIDLRFDIPSACADALARGEVDLALLPLASYATFPSPLRVVPGVAVAGRGAVRTVLLVGEVPWAQMESIALDSASRSSALLLRVLTRERGLQPRFEESDHEGIVEAAAGTRGALIIGDAGFRAADLYPHDYDLGAEWAALTGLPFVYAVWAGHPDAATPEDVALLRDSLRRGLDHRGEIARAFAAERGLPASVCEAYLHHNIRYQLGAEELSGAAAFLARAGALGVVPPGARIRFFEDGRPERPITNAPRRRRCRCPPRRGPPPPPPERAPWTGCWPTPPLAAA